MASFARSFKPPSILLSPRRRPGMPGRTLSSSSDLSLTPGSIVAAHQTDYFFDQPVTSAPNTPCVSPGLGPARDEGSHSTRASPDPTASSFRNKNSSSNPIAIEPPKLKRISPDPFSTPPEPLSARGELKRGYFPLHEDPKSRVQRSHPFFHDIHPSQQTLVTDAVTMQTERARKFHPTRSVPMSNSSTPISSYIAPGFHDAPLPVGKYYPTNYEQQHPTSASSPSLSVHDADSTSSSSKSSSQLLQARPDSSRSENPQAEMRRRMRQYQRDMIAQATMGLGASTHSAATPGVSLNGLPVEMWLPASATQKPTSPKLHPLGSPGPVTPMDLESNVGSYLDQSTTTSSPLAHAEMSASRGNLGVL